jgi:hypothetical protein
VLQAFFSSKTRVALLRLFFRNPDRKYYLREIGRMLNESITPIRRELLNLKKAGLLKDARLANLIFYEVDKDFILFDELRSMVMKAQKHEFKV